MRKLVTLGVAAALLAACSAGKQSSMQSSTEANVLTEQEKNEGWQLLFDGNSTNGWHTYGKNSVGSAWKVVDGTLTLDTTVKDGWQVRDGGDIVTNQEFEDFHFSIDWKVAPGGNSGVIFFVQDDPSKYQYTWHTGLEMQVLDNAAHPDAKIFKHRAGDLYDLIASSKETVKPAGEWNHAEIISNDGKLNLFLNGENIVSTTLWDEQWRSLIANSKFKDMAAFGTFKKGHIALQDHGDKVWFRNIKIKRL